MLSQFTCNDGNFTEKNYLNGFYIGTFYDKDIILSDDYLWIFLMGNYNSTLTNCRKYPVCVRSHIALLRLDRPVCIDHTTRCVSIGLNFNIYFVYH